MGGAEASPPRDQLARARADQAGARVDELRRRREELVAGLRVEPDVAGFDARLEAAALRLRQALMDGAESFRLAAVAHDRAASAHESAAALQERREGNESRAAWHRSQAGAHRREAALDLARAEAARERVRMAARSSEPGS
jgi:hypothetical protein